MSNEPLGFLRGIPVYQVPVEGKFIKHLIAHPPKRKLGQVLQDQKRTNPREGIETNKIGHCPQ